MNTSQVKTYVEQFHKLAKKHGIGIEIQNADNALLLMLACAMHIRSKFTILQKRFVAEAVFISEKHCFPKSTFEAIKKNESNTWLYESMMNGLSNTIFSRLKNDIACVIKNNDQEYRGNIIQYDGRDWYFIFDLPKENAQGVIDEHERALKRHATKIVNTVNFLNAYFQNDIVKTNATIRKMANDD